MCLLVALEQSLLGGSWVGAAFCCRLRSVGLTIPMRLRIRSDNFSRGHLLASKSTSNVTSTSAVSIPLQDACSVLESWPSHYLPWDYQQQRETLRGSWRAWLSAIVAHSSVINNRYIRRIKTNTWLLTVLRPRKLRVFDLTVTDRDFFGGWGWFGWLLFTHWPRSDALPPRREFVRVIIFFSIHEVLAKTGGDWTTRRKFLLLDWGVGFGAVDVCGVCGIGNSNGGLYLWRKVAKCLRGRMVKA